MIDVGAAVALIVMLPSPASRLPVQDTTHGKVVYEKWCAGCHGDGGAGDGAAAAHMLPAPPQLHRRALQDPYDGERPAPDRRGS